MGETFLHSFFDRLKRGCLTNENCKKSLPCVRGGAAERGGGVVNNINLADKQSLSRYRASSLCTREPFFLYHRKFRKPDLAVMPCLSARKAEIGEHIEAGTARFFANYP